MLYSLVPRISLGAAARFHGHLGPWLVLGLKAGEYARLRLRASAFELAATVWCAGEPPRSCFLDGIQLGSGCTLGKANLRHRHWPRLCRVQFRAGPRSVSLTLRPEVAAALERVTEEQAEPAGRRLSRQAVAALFRIAGRT